MPGDPDWTLVLRRLDDIQSEQRALRKDVLEVRQTLLLGLDYTRRLDRRMGELRDDLELIVKTEVGGWIAALETRIDEELQALRDRIDPSEAHH